MKLSATSDRSAAGLRERKKARTRSAIQRHALRLFQARGYAATTVDQIAEAAEVSPSTFFRYFATKEDVVLYDDFDPALLAAFQAQPAELSPVEAMRRAVVEVFNGIPLEDVGLERERARLLVGVPELRGRLLLQVADSIEMLAEQVARRVGRDPGDFAVRNLTGAVVGVMMACVLRIPDDPDADFVGIMSAALEHLERGLPL